MSKVDSWMPLRIGAYLADTMHLSTLEHGAYDLLLFHGWRNGGKIVNDDRLLARITKLPLDQWKAIKPTITAFFTPVVDEMLGACLEQKRQKIELALAKDQQAKAEAKARKAAEIRWGRISSDAPSIPQAMLKQCSLSKPKPIKEEDKIKRDSLKRFQPPTISEISIYCDSRKNGIDAEKFLAFYESNGWKVGKNPMKSWQMAIITWEKSNTKGGQNGIGKNAFNNYESAADKRERAAKDFERDLQASRNRETDPQDLFVSPTTSTGQEFLSLET